MTWSYDTTLPDAKNRVRFVLGDTDENDALFSDEEIVAVLTREANDENTASLQLAWALAARFARRADVAVGGLRENLSQIGAHYWELADRLQRNVNDAMAASGLSVHGVTITEELAARAMQDRVPSQFETAAFDNPAHSVKDEARDDRF